MWFLRRTNPFLRRRGCCNFIARAFSANSELRFEVKGVKSYFCHCSNLHDVRCLAEKGFYQYPLDSRKFRLDFRSICSQVITNSEDGILAFEKSMMVDSDIEEENADRLTSEPEVANHSMATEKICTSSRLFEVISAAQGRSMIAAVEKWVEEGNILDRTEISLAMLLLRKRRMYNKALQFFRWVEENKLLELTEWDYASFADLIAKVHGLQQAEKYIENIPESFRGELAYRTLLANCVNPVNVKKAEQVFQKMKELGFPITIFACNQMILAYKRGNKKKLPDILLLMEKENVKPSVLTYRILLGSKGEANDIVGMEQVVKAMNADGIEPDIQCQSILAKHYISGGITDKAKAILKDMEEKGLKGNPQAYRAILPLYASLGDADGVRRIWKICEGKPKIDECKAAIEAWGKLGKIEEAEAVFEKMLQTWAELSSSHYFVLLNVYADHKLVDKSKELVSRIGDGRSWVGPLTWNALVRLCIIEGEIEKADLLLQTASQQGHVKPLLQTYMMVMDEYAKRGDVHSTEKLLFRMRKCGFTGRLKPYEILLQAYIKAKAPVYGFRERMRADNVFPNRSLNEKLKQVEAFSQGHILDFLE